MKMKYIVIVAVIILSLFIIDMSETLLGAEKITYEHTAPDWYHEKSYESPDGSEIVVERSSRERSWSISRVYPNGTQRKLITIDAFAVKDIKWSPDGTRILIMGHEGLTPIHSAGEIFVMNADGSGLKQLTPRRFDIFEFSQFSPEWSPDGKWIVFTSRRYGGCENIWIMDSDGDNKVQVSRDGCHRNPTWSPEGDKIAYYCGFSFTGKDKGVYVADLVEKSKIESIFGLELEFSQVIISTFFLIIGIIVLSVLYYHSIITFRLFKTCGVVLSTLCILFSGILMEYVTLLIYNRGILLFLALIGIISAIGSSSVLYKKGKISRSSKIFINIAVVLFIVLNMFVIVFVFMFGT